MICAGLQGLTVAVFVANPAVSGDNGPPKQKPAVQANGSRF